MLRSRLLCTAGLVALAGAAGIGSAQAAAPAPAAAHRLAHSAVSVPAEGLAHFSHLLESHRPSPADHTANSTSNNWSGYAANSGHYTSVTSSWTEPSVSCSAQGMVAFWIGLDGYGSNSVEQDGTGVDCSSGSPQAFAWWETYPANSIQEYGDAVGVGDQLTSTITDVGSGQYHMVLTDSSRGWTEDQTVAASGSDASAEVIAEAVTSGSSVTPLPDFGSISFTGSQINGAAMPSSNPVGIDMTDSGGSVIASTGAEDSNGDFTVSYGSTSTPPAGSITVNNPGSQTSSVGSAVSLQITSTDSNSLPVAYTATGLPTGTSISKSGLISGTASTAGTYNVTVKGTDSNGGSGSTSFSWTVGTGGGGGTGCSGVAAWSATTSYAPGDQVSYNGHKWTSTWYSTGATPGAAASWNVWTDDGAC